MWEVVVKVGEVVVTILKSEAVIAVLKPIGVFGGLCALFGVMLAVAAKKLHVETDPKLEEVRESLPGANCGGCGFPGCDAFAEAVVKGDASPNGCSVGGEEVIREISEILGVIFEKKEKMVARVLCQGDKEKAEIRYIYQGPKDCQAVTLPKTTFAGGPKACPFSCVGFGNCAQACPFEAISIGENGLPQVDEGKCTGCGNCVKACPKGIIELMPVSRTVYVPCKSEYRGKAVKIRCEAGCRACRLCERDCPEQAIQMVNNLPIIDYTKCTECGICAEKCPTKTIKMIEERVRVSLKSF